MSSRGQYLIHLIVGPPSWGKTTVALYQGMVLQAASKDEGRILIYCPSIKNLPDTMPDGRKMDYRAVRSADMLPEAMKAGTFTPKRPTVYTGGNPKAFFQALNHMGGIDFDDSGLFGAFWARHNRAQWPHPLIIIVDEALFTDTWSGASSTERRDVYKSISNLRHADMHFMICTQQMTLASHINVSWANAFTFGQTGNRHVIQMVKDAHGFDLRATGVTRLKKREYIQVYAESADGLFAEFPWNNRTDQKVYPMADLIAMSEDMPNIARRDVRMHDDLDLDDEIETDSD